MSRRIDRRRFLQTSAALGIASLTPQLSVAEKKRSPNEMLHVACIGVNGKGESNWEAIVAGGANVVAYCDVDESRIGKIKSKFPNSPYYADFRVLLDKQKDLDAIVVSTPDHTHAVATAAGMQLGLHAFCEKPLAHDVYEARTLAQLAAKHKLVTQMGSQIHAGDNYRRVVEIIQTGGIGAVKEVHVWQSSSRSGGDRPKETPPVPASLNWDLWVGPSPMRPYHPAYVPFNWRGWWDFGGGNLADMACHFMDLPFWALKLRHPTTIQAEGPPPHVESAPTAVQVKWEFPARGEMPPVTLNWYDGGKKPTKFFAADSPVKLPAWDSAVLFVGEKGYLIADYGRHVLLPEDKFKEYKRPQPFIVNSVGHYREFVDACKTGGATTCNFDYSGSLTETVLLGVVSYRLGSKKLEWDAEKLVAKNEPEAERFLKREYRKGWKLV